MSSLDLRGQYFGRLIVLLENGRSKCKGKIYICRCECGNLTRVRSGNLRSGGTTSCGCYAEECSAKQNIKHGHSPRNGKTSRTYNSWAAMMQRCYDPLSTSYPRYGARGIKVCRTWHDFTNFLADMGERPINKSLDRIDNSGNYKASNCKWSTPTEQANNRRKRTKK